MDSRVKSRHSGHRFAWPLAAALALLGARAAAAPEAGGTYESLPTLKASDFLDAALLKGANYEVQEKVTNDGFFNTYTIDSPYGPFQPKSTSLARIRVHEMDAIAQLKDVDKIAVAAGAAINSVVDMGKGTYHLITNPVETAEGIGGAASRLFGRIGRSIKRSREKMDSASEADKSTGTRVAETSQSVAKSLFGVNRALRAWAERLYVDPYTHNEVLRNELQEVADYDAGGRFSTKIVPVGVVGTVLGSVSTVNSLVYSKEPDEIQTLNETRLKAMGVTPEDSSAFRFNPHYTLMVQTSLVASLDTLPDATGRPEYVAQAATAAAEVDARFFQENAYMVELFNKQEAPVLGIAPDLPGACVIAKNDRFACLYSVDYVVWTETVAGNASKVDDYVRAKHPKATRELWLTGRVSPRTAQELQARGWVVREKAMTVLPAMPVRPTPTPALEAQTQTPEAK